MIIAWSLMGDSNHKIGGEMGKKKHQSTAARQSQTKVQVHDNDT